MNSDDLRRKLAGFHLRLQTSIILAIVTGFGVLINFFCHNAGLDAIGVRYLIVIPSSYLFFFATVRIWIWLVLPYQPREENRSSSSNFLNWFGRTNSSPWIPESRTFEPKWSGDGGKFAGAGASGDWDSTSSAAMIAPFSADNSSFKIPEFKSSSEGKGNALAVFLILLLFVAVIAAALYVVWMGPNILADAVVQYACGRGIVQRLSSEPGEDDGSWLWGLFKSTVIVFIVVLSLACGAGFYVNSYCPRAKHLLDATRDVCK